MIYARFRKRARQIVSRYPSPDFYKDHSFANEMSRQCFETNSFTTEIRRFVGEHLDENFGHGLEHAVKVAIDAGALMIIENKLSEKTDSRINRRVAVVQCAGLLHDIKRRQKDHAIKGSDHARKVLKPYPLQPSELDDICRAIRNHEAFKPTEKADTMEGALVSDCLYDADKFRWGPDNFTSTVWAMVSYFNVPVAEFMALYPEGMEKLAKIKHTFRTPTGKKYGPQFIDLGVAIGQELFNLINIEFADLF